MANFGVAAHPQWMPRKPYNKKPPGKHPGHFIREWRTYREMTQERLAELIGAADASVVSKIETGDRGYRRDSLEPFAKALQCTPGDLLRPPPGTPDPLLAWAQKMAGRLSKEQQERIIRAVTELMPEPAPVE